jgi:N-glycosidase YbiA
MITSFTGKYRFLSNFYMTPVFYDGLIYPSSEHAYQAAKTLDLRYRTSIRAKKTAGEAKKLGQRVPMREDWDRCKIQVMEKILRKKFDPEEQLFQRLLETGDEELIEGNYWGDTFWGVCNGEGENHLGKLLMKIRANLAEDGK